LRQAFSTPDGLTLSYERVGEGPLLVCHPGGPGMSSLYMTREVGGLDRYFTLVLLDPRGTGGSQAPHEAAAYTTEHYVADVEALREHLGEDRLNLLGHSHGGVVAVAYAATHPQHVRRLVVANSLARILPDEMERIMQTHEDEPWYADAREALQLESEGAYSTPEELGEITERFWPMYFAHYDDTARAYVQEHLTEEGNTAALQLFNADIEAGLFDLRPLLTRIDAPTLVITGEHDFICGPSCAADLSAVPGSRTVVLEDCGHFTFVEKPDRWRELVRDFVA
jgi:proline-specific peptidase